MELKDNGRWRPRVLDELCRSIFPYNRTNFGGSPRTKEYNYSKPRSRRGPRWEDRRRRGLPIRPYLHARIPRITVVEQLPQIIFCCCFCCRRRHHQHNRHNGQNDNHNNLRELPALPSSWRCAREGRVGTESRDVAGAGGAGQTGLSSRSAILSGPVSLRGPSKIAPASGE